MKKKAVIITGPSGAGKSTLGKHLRSVNDELMFAVSATTRDMRPGETDGVEYFFLSRQDFDTKIDQNEFFEWEEFSGNKYGILKSEFDRIWALGKYPTTDIELRGAHTIKNEMDDALVIFVSPPSLEVLEDRLRARHTESPEALEWRLNRAREEMQDRDSFSAVVVNDDLETAKADIVRIVQEYLET